MLSLSVCPLDKEIVGIAQNCPVQTAQKCPIYTLPTYT